MDPINLIAPRPRPRILSTFDLWLIAAIVLWCALFVTYGVRLDHQLANTHAMLAEQDQSITDLRNKLPAIARVKQENRGLQTQLAAITQLRSDPVRYANLLWELGEVMPANCRLDSVQIDPATQTVALSGASTAAGGARALDGVGVLMRNLQASRYFREPGLNSSAATSVDGATAWTFSITVHYDAEAALRPAAR